MLAAVPDLFVALVGDFRAEILGVDGDFMLCCFCCAGVGGEVLLSDAGAALGRHAGRHLCSIFAVEAFASSTIKANQSVIPSYPFTQKGPQIRELTFLPKLL